MSESYIKISMHKYHFRNNNRTNDLITKKIQYKYDHRSVKKISRTGNEFKIKCNGKKEEAILKRSFTFQWHVLFPGKCYVLITRSFFLVALNHGLSCSTRFILSPTPIVTEVVQFFRLLRA